MNIFLSFPGQNSGYKSFSGREVVELDVLPISWYLNFKPSSPTSRLKCVAHLLILFSKKKFIVYKKISWCAELLYSVTLLYHQRGSLPVLLWHGDDQFNPQSPLNLKEVSIFRPIAWLNVENKIIWAVVGQPFMSYFVANRYLINWTQKEFLPNVVGCIRHFATFAESKYMRYKTTLNNPTRIPTTLIHPKK